MTDAKLRQLISGFRDGILNGQESNWMCIVVCAPLRSFLAVCHGIETHFIEGYLIDEEGDELHHCWLEMQDKRIIDPTADQFSTATRPMPPVYIGAAPIWYFEGAMEEAA